MWPYILSDRLLIVALVGRYPANWLIRRGSILYRIAPFPYAPCSAKGLCGISSRFQLLSPCTGQVTHALLTRPPLSSSRKKNFVRLACVKHAASVYPEPGSNSHVQFSVQFCANAFLSVCVSYLKDFTVFIGCSFYYAKNFTRLTTFVIRLFKKSSGLVILFNYQGSFVISFSTHSYCSLTVHYFIISSCICQALFSNFFSFFCTNRLSHKRLCYNSTFHSSCQLFFLNFFIFSIISIQTPFSAFFSTFIINLFSNMKKGHLSAPSQIYVLLPSINRNTEHNWLIALHSTLNMKTFLVSCPSKLSIFAKHLYLANDSAKVCLLTCILNTK